MGSKAKIFCPDTIKDKICQAVRRDMNSPLQKHGECHGVLSPLHVRMAQEIDKKYTSISRQDDDLRVTAFLKFLQVQEHMLNFGLEGLNLPSNEQMYPQTRYGSRHNILLRARAICRSILSPFSEDEWFQATKHGTGSSIGVPFIDTSLEAKSTLPMTVTKNASSLLTRYLDFDSQLKSAIVNHNRTYPLGSWYEVVEGSRATTVPKSAKIDRMIAVEPTGNMFLQQGLMTMMYVRFKRAGLDLETLPTQHRRRAQIASLTSNEATIDWSSASDCVSIELLRWLLPPMWFECLDTVRSKFMSLDKESIELSMFSTMGNAATFPLETLVFYSLAHAVRLERSGTLSHFPEWKDRHLCSVFGDDCIVPTDMAEDFIQVVCSVGFIVNKEKSFYGKEGFRESCGGDYLRGYDNRPFYLKSPTSTRLSALEPWLYIIGNRLMPKYISCFGKRNYIYEKELWSTFFGLFREYNLKIKIVPADYPDDAGLKVFDDHERIDLCFTPVWSELKVNQHGCVHFLFCRFKYRMDKKRFDELHYHSWLKTRAIYDPQSGDREREMHRVFKFRRNSFLQNYNILKHLSDFDTPVVKWQQRKVRGGYVVARGDTVQWTVPYRRSSGKYTAKLSTHRSYKEHCS
jgi:hypothetical protein